MKETQLPQAVSNSTGDGVGARFGESPVMVAQATEQVGGEPHASSDTHAGNTHASAGHGGGHHAAPLGEHFADWYSGVGLFVGLAVLVFAKSRMGRLTARNPSKGQLLIEQAVASITHFSQAMIGHGGERFAPFIGTVFAFVLCSNLCGVLPMYWWPFKHDPSNPAEVPMAAWSFTPAPTANISMTFALGFIVFVLFNAEGIRANGLGGHLKHFAGPMPALAPLIFPIELIGALVRPVSLAMRLFGNVFGEETVIAVLIMMAASLTMGIIPFQAPMLAFGVFGSVVQAGVFAILTCSYIALSIGDHGHDHADHGHEEHGAAHAH
jgi:F-type H+-transporting ATPase subunit a